MRSLAADASHDLTEQSETNDWITIDFTGWRRLVRDRLNAGWTVAEVWARSPEMKGDAVHILEGDQDAKDPADSGSCFYSLAARLPVITCTLLMVPGFVLGLACGLQCDWSMWSATHVTNAVPFIFLGFIPMAFERALAGWGLCVWSAWAFLVWMPFSALNTMDFSTGNAQKAHHVAFARKLLVIVLTCPVHITVMKIFDFRWSERHRILRLMAVVYLAQGACLSVLAFFRVDSALVERYRSGGFELYFTLRPVTVYMVKRLAYSLAVAPLYAHPSAPFRVTFLFILHLGLGTLSVSAACKASTLLGLGSFLLTDAISKALCLYCFTLSGTELLKRYTLLRLLHTPLTMGKPAPFPGMVKSQYRAVELTIMTMTATAVACGLLVGYYAIFFWIQDMECLRPALDFWFPMREQTICFLCVILLKEGVFELCVHWLVLYKTGLNCKHLFQHWLRTDSMVGWQAFVMASLAVGFLPMYLTRAALEASL